MKNTGKAGFDSFLKLFLSRCLVDDKFEELQHEIEVLQADRYDNATLRRTARNVSQTKPEVAPASGKEMKLVGKRDQLLQEVLDQSLKNVLKIANDGNVRELLKKFADRITDGSLETIRYGPYAELNNNALDKLAEVKDPSLRTVPKHRLCLSRADPLRIKATFFDSKEVTTRVPDFVRTSKLAASATHPQANIGEKPTKAFQWHEALSVDELKARNGTISPGAHRILEGGKFTGIEKDPRIEYTFTPVETPDTMREIILLQNTKSGTKRARPEANNENPSSSKKSRTSATGAKTPADSNSVKNIDARVQVAGYAMEMMSYGPGVVYVINTLTVDEYIYVQYHDRQGALCSDGISIIADFPRFLVLLLAFQRFRAEDWGIVPCLNPQALARFEGEQPAGLDNLCFPLQGDHFATPPYVSPDIQGPLFIDLNKYLSAQPHSLFGRMTSVFKARNCQNHIACKMSSPEVQRIPEGDVLKTIEAIADKRAPEMRKHLPKYHFSGDLRVGNTLRARSILKIDGRGHRTLRIVGLNELAPLTSLTDGKSFVKAWFDVVAFHAFLWKHGIEHGDPSLWNVMVDPASKCGVLTDYDLTVMAWLERVPGIDRTGTIPFMALDLLCQQYWDGKINRYHHHELEAFLWILPVVFLACDQGNLDLHTKFIKGWFTSDYAACWGEKTFFLYRTLGDASDSVHGNFKEFALLMLRCCMLIKRQHNWRSEEEDNLSLLPGGAKAHGGDASYVRHSEAMWDAFLDVLYSSSIDVDISKLLNQKPIFDIAQCQELFKEAEEIFRSVTQNKLIT